LEDLYKISINDSKILSFFLQDLVLMMKSKEIKIRELSFILVSRFSLNLSPNSEESNTILDFYFSCLDDPHINETALHFACNFFHLCGDKENYFLNKLFSLGSISSPMIKLTINSFYLKL
jgi:hypothetical protein